MRVLFLAIQFFFFLSIFFIPSGYSWQIQSNILKEDFSDFSHWDKQASTGLWNIVDHAAQAARVTGGNPNRLLSFGDGADGALDSTTGYVFDTDSHPQGFNFLSVNIRGGVIQVKGSKPLVIRSLSTIDITPTLSVQGGNGNSGVANGASTKSLSGIAVASVCAGGQGGLAEDTPTGDGDGGVISDGTIEISGGIASNGFDGGAAAGPFDGPDIPANWDNAGAFRCGAGGGGGGGYTDISSYATGGSGGAGGGTIRMVAVGKISLGTVDARGGDGGNGATDAFCSGSGAGGNGGAVWLQTLKTVSANTPLVDAGNPGIACFTSAGTGLSGLTRIDTASTSDAGDFSTEKVAPNQTYTIQSLEYDLQTVNAGFSVLPTIETDLNNGSISVTYSGSTDGIQFSDPTTDLFTLSNRNFRYIKFKLTIHTASAAGPSPQVKSISIPYSELNIRLAGGCGTVKSYDARNTDSNDFWDRNSLAGLTTTLFWLAMYYFIYLLGRSYSVRR